MPQRDPGTIPAGLHRKRHDRLSAARGFGHPRLLDHTGPIEAKKAPVMSPCSALVPNREVIEAVDDGIDNRTLPTKPRTASALGVEPKVEHLLRARREDARYGDFDRRRHAHPIRSCWALFYPGPDEKLPQRTARSRTVERSVGRCPLNGLDAARRWPRSRCPERKHVVRWPGR